MGPLLVVALEVWPGVTPDKSTVIQQIQMLKERFRVKQAIFVGDKGMYQEAAIEEIEKAGSDYVFSLENGKSKGSSWRPWVHTS